MVPGDLRVTWFAGGFVEIVTRGATDAVTITVTGSEGLVFPAASGAVAYRRCDPAGMLAAPHTMEYGVVADPISVPLWREKSTRVIMPKASVAPAETVTLPETVP